MRKITTTLLTGSALLLFTACGGGGSDSGTNPTPTEYTYNLQDYLNTYSGHMNLEGTAYTANGNIPVGMESIIEYVGTYTATTGETLHQKDQTQIYNINGTSIISTSSVGFYKGYMAELISYETGVYCGATLSSSSVTPIPKDAKIGYVSDTIPLECSDGTSMTYLLKLESAGGSNALMKGILNAYSNNGALVGSSTSETIVTPSMDIINYHMEIKDLVNGGSAILDSTSISQN